MLETFLGVAFRNPLNLICHLKGGLRCPPDWYSMSSGLVNSTEKCFQLCLLSSYARASSGHVARLSRMKDRNCHMKQKRVALTDGTAKGFILGPASYTDWYDGFLRLQMPYDVLLLNGSYTAVVNERTFSSYTWIRLWSDLIHGCIKDDGCIG